MHHGEALEPAVDVRRPLSPHGQQTVARLAAEAAALGVAPTAVWHSGKLRARQTAEAFWRACNPFATFLATRGLQPGDPPVWVRDRLLQETGDILIAGHYPHLPRLLSLLLTNQEAASVTFPLHGVVGLRSDDQGESWAEEWRLADSP